MCWCRIRVQAKKDLDDNVVKYYGILQCSVSLNELAVVTNIEHRNYGKMVDRFGYSVEENERLIMKDLEDK